jgi:predicted nucleotidyltransferase
MPDGLRDSDLQHIADAIHQFNEISEVILFGSRAKGNYKAGSDVDLAIKGDRVTQSTVLQLADCLNEEKPLPYFFDIIHYETINEPKLVQHIDRVGVVIFRSSSSLS